jgi:ZIP family zinc transporter
MTIWITLLYALAPTLAIPAGAWLIGWRPPTPLWRSILLHFAAGGLIAVIAMELLAEFEDRSPVAVAIGILSGTLFMGALQSITERIERSSGRTPVGFIAVVAVDFAIDGLLLGVALHHDSSFGLVLAVALTLEDLVTGLSVASAIVETMPAGSMLRIMALLALGFPAGAIIGAVVGGMLTGPAYAAVLAFACVALLFLALEELLKEAHEMVERPWVTSTLFLGLLAFLLLEMTV